MTLMAVRKSYGALGTVYDLAQVDEASAQLLLQFALYDALCTEVDKAAPMLEHALAGHFIREADGMLEQTAKRYTLAKSLGQSTDELEQVAEHLAQAREAWVEVSKALTPEQFDALESQGVINRDDSSGRFTSGKIRRSVLNALGLATGKPDSDVDRRTHEALQGLVGDQADSYTRMRALGQGLIATGNPQARAAGTAARLVADIGPEAQRVLEPGIRRTAYRYRGTEKKPSKQAQLDAIVVAEAGLQDLNAAPPAVRDAALRAQVDLNAAGDLSNRRVGRAVEPLTPLLAALAANPKSKGSSTDQVQLSRTSDFGALTLRTQVPDIDTAMISLAAGKMPPSVGMMFDEDGRLVSEAQGFNGDHYLPFDLKNLKRLKGGSYVRTRTTGGLTDEDIYTGLMTGARQVTVVSNSGVFTLEFDPTLRGGRRYSDKARAMVQRYGALTKTIGGGGLQQTDIPRAEMQQLKVDAVRESGGDAALASQMFNSALEAKRFESSFVGVDEDSLMDQAQAETARDYRGESTPQQRTRASERFRELKAETLKSTAKKYKLDHDGYAAAQKALAAEFPYFIREQKTTPMNEYLVSHHVLAPTEELPRRGGRDIGYTQPGELAPLKGADRKVQPEQTRTGLRSRAAEVGVERSASGVPVIEGQQTPKPQVQQAAGAKSWETVQQVAAQRSSVKLARALDVLGVAPDLKPVPQLITIDGKLVGPDQVGYEGLTGLEYARWAVKYFHDDMQKMAAFLQDPANAEHLEYVQGALEELHGEMGTTNFGPRFSQEKIAQAQQVLATASGSNFAPVQGDWVLAVPGSKSPAPPLVPELESSGADMKGIEAYARSNHEVTAQAAQFESMGDDEIAETIRDSAEQVNELAEWGGEGPPPPNIDASQARVARLLAGQSPELTPVYRQLATMQAAWSLKRANAVVAAAENVAPLDLKSLGKARAPALPGAQEVGKRLVMHAPNSPAAVGLAKRRAASPLLVRLPVSR